MRLEDALRKAIAESDVSHAAIERATGVNRLTISRFLRGLTSLRLDKADDLAEFLGIDCQIKQPNKAHHSKPRDGKPPRKGR